LSSPGESALPDVSAEPLVSADPEVSAEPAVFPESVPAVSTSGSSVPAVSGEPAVLAEDRMSSSGDGVASTCTWAPSMSIELESSPSSTGSGAVEGCVPTPAAAAPAPTTVPPATRASSRLLIFMSHLLGSVPSPTIDSGSEPPLSRM
jgi:hypothetical protein